MRERNKKNGKYYIGDYFRNSEQLNSSPQARFILRLKAFEKHNMHNFFYNHFAF